MPRHHRRKTTRWINEDCMQAAVADICNGVETPSTAARKYGLKRTTIIYRVERKQKMEQARAGNPEVKKTPPLVTSIFTEKQEKELMEFLNRYTYLPYDTSSSYQAARQLVYQFVKSHDIKRPKMWDVEQQAGVDWLKGFIERNPQTNLRKPATWSPKKSADEDEASMTDSAEDQKLPFVTQTDRTDIISTPLVDVIPLPEPSLGSDISRVCSLSHFMDTTPLRPLPKPSSYGNDDGSGGLELEPECDIIFPVVSIKQESTTNTESPPTRGVSASSAEIKPEISRLDTLPVDDDVFNSFGRNIAFQVKELHRLNRLEAYELMHEVQTLVNRRLIGNLRLTRRKENSIRTSEMLVPRVIQIDDDDEA